MRWLTKFYDFSFKLTSLSQTIWPTWASRQFLSLPIVQTLLPVTFHYFLSSRKNLVCRYETIEEMKEAVTKVIDTLTKRTFMGPSRSCWNGTTSALRPEEITSKGTRVSCVYYQQKCPYEMLLLYIYICSSYIYICAPPIYIYKCSSYIYMYAPPIYIYIYKGRTRTEIDIGLSNGSRD